jgi:gliding motility-associated-like protein
MKKLYTLYLLFLPFMASLFTLPATVTANGNSFGSKRIGVTDRPAGANRREATIAGAAISTGKFKAGDELLITLYPSDEVFVTGTPLIPVFFDVGGSVLASYVPNGNTTALTFRLYIPSGVFDTTGVSLAGNYSGGIIQDGAGVPLSPFLPNYTSPNTKVDAVPPAIVSTSISEGKFKAADQIVVTLQMSEDVIVDGSAFVGIYFDGGGYLEAHYIPDGNPGTLRFGAGIPWGYHANGVTVAGSIGGGTVKDMVGNPLSYGVPSYTSINTLVDAIAPAIASITLPADKVYHIGEDLIFVVNFTEDVVQSGASTLVCLTYGGVYKTAVYLDSLDSNKRRFKYTVTEGDNAKEGLFFNSQYVLTGGNHYDSYGNPLSYRGIPYAIPYPNNIILDGIRPVINSIVRVPPNVRNDDKAYFQVSFSKEMAQVDHQVSTSAGLTAVEHISTADNKNFQYNYTVTGNGTIHIAFPASASTTDVSGNAMTSSYISDSFTIDQTAPVISHLDLPADSIYRAGDQLTFTTHFSEPVVFSGSLTDISLKILVGSTVKTLPAVSITAGTATFEYPVSSGDNDADGITIQSFDLATANTIADSATSNLVTTLDPAQVINHISIDNISPAVTGYTALPGHYGTGQAVTITAQFDEPVNVTGAPYLTASTGAFAKKFEYAGGSGTNTLRFTYTVPAGREDSTTLLLEQRMELNGGTVKDAAGNAIILSAPNTTSFNGLYFDGVAPTVTSIQLTDPKLRPSGVLHFIITTSEPVTAADLSQMLTVHTPVTVNSITVMPTAPNIFAVAVDVSSVPDTALPLTITVPGAVPVKDLAGNAITDAVTSDAYSIDGLLPVVTGITLPANKIYKLGERLFFTVHVNKLVILRNGPALLELTLNQGGVVWAYCSMGGYELLFGYTVQYNDLDMDGIQLPGAVRFDPRFPTSSLTDQAGQPLALTIPGMPSAAGISIDGVLPKLTSWMPMQDSTYKIGDTIKMEAQASENIYITGSPALKLKINGVPDTAQVITASAPDRLAYGYVVKEGPEGFAWADGFVTTGTIQDTAGNDLEFIPGPFLYRVYVDATRPQITGISTPQLKGKIGDEVPIDVMFNEKIVSTATASLTAKIGGKTVLFGFKTWKDEYTATFTYQVQEGDADSTGVIITGMSGITDMGGNESFLKNNDTTSLLIDGIRLVLDSMQLLSGTLTNDRVVRYLLHVSEPVNPLFTPNFVTTGDIAVGNINISGTGRDVQLEVTTTGDHGSIQLVLDPAVVTIADDYGNAARQHTLSSDIVRIQVGTPVLTGIVNPPDGIYRAGDVLTYAITTSVPPVIKNGVPAMTLFMDNLPDFDVPLTSIHGDTLVFKYTVKDGEESYNGVFYRLNLQANNSQLTDSAGNIFSLVIPRDPWAPDPRNIVHAKSPAIIDISTTQPRIVPKNDGILFYVQFDRGVTASPEVTLKVTIGQQTIDVPKDTVINQHNPVSSYLIFNYETEGGEYDMDGITVDAINLNGGTIKDDFNNAKINFTQKVFSDVQVDAIVPVITAFRRLDPSPTKKDTLHFQVVFNKKMKDIHAYGFRMMKSPGIYYPYPYAITTISDSIYMITVARAFGTGTIGLQPIKWQNSDIHGNYIEQDSLVSELYTIDNYPPYVMDLVLPPAGTYKPGDAITIKALISEPVNIAGAASSIDLTLNTGGTVKAYLVKNDSAALIFQYTVKDGEGDTDGITINSKLQLNGGSMADAMGNPMYIDMDSVPATTAILIDGIGPGVTGITIPPATYKIGDAITATVTFSENVRISNQVVVPFLIGHQTVNASFTGVTGATATFTYIVKVGDVAITALSVTTLQLNGGTVTDTSGNRLVTFNIAAPQAGVLVDGIRPVVISFKRAGTDPTNSSSLSFALVTSEAIGNPVAGDFDIAVTGSTTATVAGVVKTGPHTFTVTLGNVHGTGTAGLTFKLNHHIADVPGNLMAANQPASEVYHIDDVPPVITGITLPANGTYGNNDQLVFKVKLSEPVVVTGTPAIALTLNTGGTVSAYLTGQTPVELTFGYTIADQQLDLDGIRIDPLLQFNGGSITDAASNPLQPAINGLPASNGILVDATTARVLHVTTPQDTLYKAGDVITVQVAFNKPVNVLTGILLPVTIGSKVVNATTQTASNLGIVTFKYIIEKGLQDDDGIYIGQLMMNSGAIVSTNNQQPATVLFTAPATSAVKVDAVAPYVVSVKRASVSPVSKGVVTFMVTLSEANTTITDPANYHLVLTGDVQAAIGNALAATASFPVTAQITGGNGTVGLNIHPTVTDRAGNLIDLSNAYPNESFVVANIAANVTAVAVPANGTYKPGDQLLFKVSYNDTVYTKAGDPAPYLEVMIGQQQVKAIHTRTDGTDLYFEYTVAGNDLDEDGIAIGSTIKGALYNKLGVAASVTLLHTPATTGILVDGVAPKVVSVHYPAAARYPLNSTVYFDVNFSEAVKFAAASSLGISFNMAGKTAIAYCVSGNGTRLLRFAYKVAAGDEGNNIALNTAIQSLSGGLTLTDLAGNASDYTLYGIPANSNIYMDGMAPFVRRITPLSPAVSNAGAVKYAILFSEAVTSFTMANIAVNTTGSLTTPLVSLTYPGADSVVVTADQLAGAGTLTLGIPHGGTATDLAGNPLAATSATFVYTIDRITPTVILSTTAGSRVNSPVLITAVFSKPVTGFTQADISVQGPGAVTGFSGSGTTYTFTLTPVADGTVSIQLLANVGVDATGNSSMASNQLSVLFDRTAPVISAAGPFSTAERSAAGTVISTLLATDASHIITGWKITTNADQNANQVPDFSIDAGTGVLMVNDRALDYSGVKTVSIQVTVGDGLNTSAAQIITINITDVKSIPSDIILSKPDIPENNIIHAVVGPFTTTDADAGDTFVYTLVSGAGDTDNSSFSISGNTLRANEVLDYEVKHSYTVRVRTTDSDGSFIEKAFTIRVTDVNEAPTLSDIAGETLCADAAIHTMTVDGISAGPEAGQLITPVITADQPFFDVLTAVYNNDSTLTIKYQLKQGVSGDVFVTLTIRDNGGMENGGVDKVSKSFILTLKTTPVLSVSTNPVGEISIGDVAILTASGGATYAWADANGIVSGKNTAVLTVRPTVTTTYTVTAQSTEGCAATAAATVTVKNDFKFEATNIVTPNGDGINDRWVIRNIDMYPLNKVDIYTRGGRLVYTKNGYNNGWDGTVNGNPLPEDTYYYVVDLGAGGKKIKGFITILRDRK